MYVLDTDIFSLYQNGHSADLRNVINNLSNNLAITVITVEEQLSGWYAMLRRAKTHTQVEDAYARLAVNARNYGGWLILDFFQPSILCFDQLRSMKLGVGGNDLRIAAIVLEHSATLVTRNKSDFQRVPGLIFEDWSV